MIEELGAGEEEFAVEFEDLVQFGGNVATNNVLDAYPRRLKLSNLCDLLVAVAIALSQYAAQQRRIIWMPGSQDRIAQSAWSCTHLEKLCHFASLLFRFRRILLLHHA